MRKSSRFKINTPGIIHETIESEVVMVNLNNGIYYSMAKTGAVIWNLIDQGMTVKQIIELIKDKFSGESSEIERGIGQLLEELQKEQLILLIDETDGSLQSNILSNDNSLIEKKTFEMPVLQKYMDMQDLLLLDPIHDVDEMGWPDPKKASGSNRQ